METSSEGQNKGQKSNSTKGCGRQGELCIMGLFRDIGWQVEDLTNDPVYQSKDIDIRVKSPSGRSSLTIEVKNDRCASRTGNLFIETEVCRKGTVSPGWARYCEADVLCYIFADTGKILFLKWKALRQMIIAGAGKDVTFHNRIDRDCMVRGRLLNVDTDIRKSKAFWKETDYRQLLPRL